MRTFEQLTREEIEQRYPDQLVVVVEPEWLDPSSKDVTRARVVAAGPDWEEAVARARPLLTRRERWVCGFTGHRPMVFEQLVAIMFIWAYRFYGCRYTGTIRGPLTLLKQLELAR